jgi:hypothetical protein
MVRARFISIAAFLVVTLAVAGARGADGNPATLVTPDSSGWLRTVGGDGDIDFDSPFFQDLGTNGRRCVSCHQPDSAWTITPANVQLRFLLTRGTDPIFHDNDGSNCEGDSPKSLIRKMSAYSLLLGRGLIRVGLDVPADAEFTIDAVADPNHCAPASNDASLYRRPLPATNLRFLSAVMWDGRESSATSTILDDLAHQANDATRGHAQAAADLTDEQARAIVAFETNLYTAQQQDRRAGSLAADGAGGGARALSRQPFFLGTNDPVGLNPSGAVFDPNAFTIFGAWSRKAPSRGDLDDRARQSIARGEVIFNSKPITITGVAGLSGQTFGSGVTVPTSFSGTCTVCHDTPNTGNHSVKAPLNIGVADPVRAPYLPVYTLRNRATGDVVQTTDPGRAMITGKWADIGKFKGPVLRALAARPPYFHNGSAATIEEVIDFYDERFGIGFTDAEKRDLAAFLRAL